MTSFISSICVDDIGVMCDVKTTPGDNFHVERTSGGVGPFGEAEEHLSLGSNPPHPIGVLGEGTIMPWPKGMPHSEETKRKISKGLKGRKWSKEHRRKADEARRGKPLSIEHRKKISLAKIGKSLSEETRRKMSEAHKGRKFSEEHRRNLSKALMGNQRCKGYHRVFSEEIKEKIRRARLNQVFPKEDSSIEIIMQNELNGREYIFKTHVPLLEKYQGDIVINNIVIECDGDYWHNFPDRIERDCIRDRELTEAGYCVLRFWGHEIKSDVKGCVDKIVEVVEDSKVVVGRVTPL